MFPQGQFRQTLCCNRTINYATTNPAFPFTIELDLASSNLFPASGENQRFCYTITGTGSDSPQFTDISHFVLGICENITAAQIVTNSIEVFIGGVPQEVVFGEGGNVELFTQDQPDPTTGCPGLKFNFPVNKISGAAGSVLSFCFSLNTAYPVGPNDFCLKGGQQGGVAEGQTICGPACAEPSTCCLVTAYQEADVCALVTVTPIATAGTITTVCCGTPVITPGATQCSGPTQCTFTITQTVCLTVPVTFGAEATVADPTINCQDPTLTNVCATCNNG